MKTAAELAQEGTVESGIELGRRFGGSRVLPELAARWGGAFSNANAECEHIAIDDASSKALGEVLRHVRPRHADAAPLVGALVEKPDPHRQLAALRLLRAPAGAGVATLLAFAKGAGPRRRHALASAFVDNAALTAELLGPPELREEPCDCGRQHDVQTDVLHDHVLLILARHAQAPDAPFDVHDEQLLAGVPLGSWLEIPGRLLYARLLRADGLTVPGLDAEAERLLDNAEVGLAGAAWLAGTGRHTDAVVSAVVRRVVESDEPVTVLRALIAAQGDLGGGIFHGRGWKRNERPRKLKPLAVALLDRRVWPGAELEKLMAHAFPKPGKGDWDSEAGWVGVQELLAEGLLAIAMDESRAMEERRRAINALGVLRPGGDGSWLRALGRIREPALETACREVVSAARDHGPATDAQLAVSDAAAALWGRLRGSG